jgi:hypothetical protein
MCDKLIFDLSQEIEGSPNVFIRKDWINILDNQNQNYNNNQSVVDTSQLSNSNKYMSYRESYFLMPFLVTIQQVAQTTSTTPPATIPYWSPATTSADFACGLKNWFGQIIHSFTLDYNGTTICQQTPYINMWNSFKLMTSLSLDDINTQGATIGFYPDDATSWQFLGVGSGTDANHISGQGLCNNTDTIIPIDAGQVGFNNFDSGKGNDGYLRRQQLINFDLKGKVGTPFIPTPGQPSVDSTYELLLASGEAGVKNVWKSYISNKVNSAVNKLGCIQFSIVATVYLKHVHSFFNMCPLLKGVFMKMTMNLNNTTTDFTTLAQHAGGAGNTLPWVPSALVCTGVTNAIGGVNPLLLTSARASSAASSNTSPPVNPCGGMGLFPAYTVTNGTQAGGIDWDFKMNISVGARVLDSSLAVSTSSLSEGQLARSVYLYIPAYTFNPTFEQAYLSSPVKQIKYTDVYQYQVQNIGSGNTFNNLLTNGIANVKSLLILPFYSPSPEATSSVLYGTASDTTTSLSVSINRNTGVKTGIPVWQSPFDPAGTGPTSPLCWISNFNVQVSGQNAIYNTQKYNFEQFNNQLYGQNAVNGGCTDGLTSGLIDRQRFDFEYCYYYVNVERMLPVETSVPKSIQILGTSQSAKALDLWCFVEYGAEISIDCLTGARV